MVALAWVMAQGGGGLVYPIVGLRGTAHIAENLRALTLQLSGEDLAQLDQASPSRGVWGLHMTWHYSHISSMSSMIVV